MPITHSCQISRIFYSAILKASEIPHISASNIFLFEPRETLRSCHSSIILSFFQTIAAPILALSNLDPSEQSLKSAFLPCALKIALFLSSISSFPGNLELEIDRIGSVFLAGSIIKLTETCHKALTLRSDILIAGP